MATFVEFTGTAKLDKRTKRLVKRLGPSDIAIIDHPNLDRISAEELLESGVRIVVNVSSSSTGDYPNAGPLALELGGVCLIVGAALIWIPAGFLTAGAVLLDAAYVYRFLEVRQ